MRKLHVENISRSLKFYIDKLGFILEWHHQLKPGEPRIAQLSAEDQHLLLSEFGGDGESKAVVEFATANLSDVHKKVAGRGIDMVFTSGDQDSAAGIEVADPDGNRLRFRQALSSPPPFSVDQRSDPSVA